MDREPKMTGKPNRHLTLLALILLAGSVTVTATSLAQDDDPAPALPADTLATSIELLYARPFLLDAPAVHASRAGQPTYAAGVLLVIEVGDRSLIHPRQVAMPILYVGDQTAERLNTGHESGRLVVIVPSVPDGDGGVALDLTTTPIFFGTPGLPEQVDAATIPNVLVSDFPNVPDNHDLFRPPGGNGNIRELIVVKVRNRNIRRRF